MGGLDALFHAPPFSCTTFLCLQIFIPLLPTCSHWPPPCPYLSPTHSFLPLMCLFYFAESCVMTKASLPGCMQSALVSCPYEVWGPSRALPAPPGLPFPSRKGQGGGAGGGWRPVTPAHTLSCLTLMETSHKHKRTHTDREQLDLPDKIFFFFFCCLGQMKMLT